MPVLYALWFMPSILDGLSSIQRRVFGYLFIWKFGLGLDSDSDSGEIYGWVMRVRQTH